MGQHVPVICGECLSGCSGTTLPECACVSVLCLAPLRNMCFCNISPMLAKFSEQDLPLAPNLTLLYISKVLTTLAQASYQASDTWDYVSGPIPTTACFPTDPMVGLPITSRALGRDSVEQDGPVSPYPGPVCGAGCMLTFWPEGRKCCLFVCSALTLAGLRYRLPVNMLNLPPAGWTVNCVTASQAANHFNWQVYWSPNAATGGALTKLTRSHTIGF